MLRILYLNEITILEAGSGLESIHVQQATKLCPFRIFSYSRFHHKPGCVVSMDVDSILPHAESGPNDHLKDAPQFKVRYNPF